MQHGGRIETGRFDFDGLAICAQRSPMLAKICEPEASACANLARSGSPTERKQPEAR